MKLAAGPWIYASNFLEGELVETTGKTYGQLDPGTPLPATTVFNFSASHSPGAWGARAARPARA